MFLFSASTFTVWFPRARCVKPSVASVRRSAEKQKVPDDRNSQSICWKHPNPSDFIDATFKLNLKKKRLKCCLVPCEIQPLLERFDWRVCATVCTAVLLNLHFFINSFSILQFLTQVLLCVACWECFLDSNPHGLERLWDTSLKSSWKWQSITVRQWRHQFKCGWWILNASLNLMMMVLVVVSCCSEAAAADGPMTSMLHCKL